MASSAEGPSRHRHSLGILKGRDQTVLRAATGYALEFGNFTYTAVSVLEILFGLHFRDAHKQLALAHRSFSENDVITPQLEDYEVAGQVRGNARKQGAQLTSDDCLVGSVAYRLSLPVATGNTAHFVAMQRGRS